MKTIIEVLIALINLMYMHQIISFDYGKYLIDELNKEYKKITEKTFVYSKEQLNELHKEYDRKGE